MDLTLANLPLAQAYLDEIIICGDGLQQYFERSCEFLSKFIDMSIKIKEPKCQFKKKKHVEYLGHTLPAKGYKSIEKSSITTNVHELK